MLYFKFLFRPSENLPQCQNLAKQRGFQEAYGTTRPYGFTAGQLAAFGKGQSSPMAELAAGGNGIYLKPEYINASINSRIPEPVRQKAGELANQAGDAWRYNKAVLDNTAGKIRNQLGSQLDGSWDSRKTFGANAADKLAGSAGIIKTGLNGLGETTAGKVVGKAVDKVTPDAVKRGIGNAADYSKRSLDSWAGNDLNRQSYANALWGAAAVVVDSRLPGKGRGKGHGRHDHDGHARSHDGHNGGKDGGHAHDRADADGGSRAGTSHRHSHDEAGNGGSASGAAHTSTGRSWSDGTFESPRRPEHNRNSDRPRQETPKPERPTRDKPDSPPSRPDAPKLADKPNIGNNKKPEINSHDGIRTSTNISYGSAAERMAAKNRLDDYKARNPDNIKGIERKGLGYLEGQINGKQVDDKIWSSGSIRDNEPKIFDSFEVQGNSGASWDRATDAEYKMLNDLASKLGAEKGRVYPEITGELTIVSGYKYCSSCQGVINQFHTMFPNIKLKLIDQIQGGLSA